MILGCPGARFFKQPEPEPEALKCPFCGGEVEIWTDEIKVICPDCGNYLIRKQPQSCLDWCKFAKDCVGRELYDKYLNNKFILDEKRQYR